MEFNRNQYFLAGLVILLLGLQFRAVETFTLTKEASVFLAEQFPPPNQTPSQAAFTSWKVSASPPPSRTIRPPRWLGYSLISVGSVLILHSLALKKPG
ncbi:MAG: hypothetical protein FJ297_06805 [Planctomycetes bacterium]|nr:hypothetical protein [Planctomycetota bacterium]